MRKAIATLVAVVMVAVVIDVTVAAAAVSTTHVKAQTPTRLFMQIGTEDGTLGNSLTVKVGDKYAIVGALTSGTTKIGGATIKVQASDDKQTWINAGSLTTFTEGKYEGMFLGSNTARNVTGTAYLRTTYDGDSQYAPTVSNVVTLTVTQ